MKEIRKIIEFYDGIDHQNEKAALASVVNIEESSYRRIGARMLVLGSGLWVGGISGGCLEGDALKRSQQAIFKNKPSKVVYDILEDDKSQIGVGLGCNGKIEVLFNPIDPNDPLNAIDQLKEIVKIAEPAVLLKIIGGARPDQLGVSKLFKLNNTNSGYLSFDQDIINSIISEVFYRRKSKVCDVKDETGNEVQLLAEFIKPETKLIIIGNNYDVNSLVNIAHELGWEITLVGKPKKFSKSSFRLAKKVLDYREAKSVTVNAYTAVVIMTHDLGWDKKMIPIFIEKEPAYLGLLGPKKRMEKIKDQLNIDLDKIESFHAPTGLDIGAENPEEIALAICSEIIASFRNRSGKNLKHRSGPIHEREL